ncbi:MAG: hypothetical protein J5999_09975 [Oscillospiraceae bacterium]|nr:hypothetical protein [Oscillospiraceae bacterium]
MADLEFTSSLSNEEIEENFSDIDFFTSIISGLEEAIAYEKGLGEANTVVRKYDFPDDNSIIKAQK